MGCLCSMQQNQADEVDHTQFVNLVNKLSTEFEIEMNRCRSNELQATERFKNQVSKDAKARENYVQQQLMEEIVYKRDKQIIYRQIILECRKILDNKHLLSLLLRKKKHSQSENGRKNLIMTPIQVVLFSGDITRQGSISQMDTDLSKMQQIVYNKYPEVTPIQKTPYDLINHYKRYRRPNHQMIKEWLFGFCSSQDISVSTVNKAGHSFIY